MSLLNSSKRVLGSQPSMLLETAYGVARWTNTAGIELIMNDVRVIIVDERDT